MLRKVSEDITPDYPNLKELIDDMYETLAASEGIGLAAPQIGRNIRVVIIDLDVISEDLPEYKGFKKVFINPHIIEIDENSETATITVGLSGNLIWGDVNGDGEVNVADHVELTRIIMNQE